MSILNEELKSFEYYKSKLPMYLQTSYGFIEHFRIWYDLMMSNAYNKGVIGTSDLLLALIEIFSPNYINKIRDLPGSGSESEYDYGDVSDFLDKLGKFFGVSRRFSCTYDNEGVLTTEELVLDNLDLLVLIKAQVIKNYCEGTYTQMKSYYEDAGLYVAILTNMSIDYATANLILQEVPEAEATGNIGRYSDNIKKMFKAGLLGIESMGIQYIYSVAPLNAFLIWHQDGDPVATNNEWDEGVWWI